MPGYDSVNRNVPSQVQKVVRDGANCLTLHTVVLL